MMNLAWIGPRRTNIHQHFFEVWLFLGGGISNIILFIFTLNFGKNEPNLTSICFRWVGEKPPTIFYVEVWGYADLGYPPPKKWCAVMERSGTLGWKMAQGEHHPIPQLLSYVPMVSLRFSLIIYQLPKHPNPIASMGSRKVYLATFYHKNPPFM